MRTWIVLFLGCSMSALLSSVADAACKTYNLTSSSRTLRVKATMISNFGPGGISVSPPGIRMQPNDLFLGDLNYTYEVALVRGSRSKIEVCD